MKLRNFILTVLLFSFLLTYAEIPAGYYNSADGKNASALRTALKTIITNGHSVTSYAGLWTAYKTTDVNANDKIWDMYSNCTFTYSTDQCGSYSNECDCYNREHTTPQSWFNEASPMVSDLFNVYPTDGKVNGMRSNYPYGEVGSATYTSGNGSKLGASSFSGYSGTVFEPVDEYKGDFARTYFYMATRYADECGTWTGEATAVYSSSNGLTEYGKNLFLKWSREDPVSQKEIDRNNAVYAIQNNRNPFIDYPGLEEYIWGTKTSEVFYVNASVSKPSVSSPTATNVTYNSAVLGGTVTSTGGGTITETGVYYSTTDGFADGTGTKVSTSSPSTSTFTVSINGLNSSTTYYFKAFATNSAGTGYSAQSSFTTTTLSSGNNPEIILGNPVSTGSTLNFGKVTSNSTKSLLIKTNNLTGDLSVSLTGEMFRVSVSTISKSDAENGFLLNVSYQPTATGSHTGNLSISGGGLTSNFTVQLTGSK